MNNNKDMADHLLLLANAHYTSSATLPKEERAKKRFKGLAYGRGAAIIENLRQNVYYTGEKYE